MFPQQRLSYRDKIKNNYQWAKDTVDYIISTATPYSEGDYDRMRSNYRLYNNIIDQKDFEKECNPLGIDVSQIKDEIKPYNKTYNKIQVLLGEELSRPFNFKAVLASSEGVKSKLAHRDMLLRKYVLSQIQNTLKSLSINFTPEELEDATTQIMDPAQIEAYMKTSYMDAREILANKILSYLSKYLSIPELRNDSFKHALIAAKEILYVTHTHSLPVIEVVNPLNFFYHSSPDIKYIEDSLYAGHYQYLSIAEILDYYGDYLTEDQKKHLEEDYPAPYTDKKASTYIPYNQPTHDPFLNTFPNLYQVYTVEWVSQKKIGFLTFTNEYGDEVTEIVSEDFSIPSNATTYTKIKDYDRKCKYYTWVSPTNVTYDLTFEYVPEVWTAVRIGTDMYCKIGPKTHQLRSQDNPYNVKLSYHGTIYNDTNAAPVSVMDRMKPFQFLYLIVMHKMKQLIAHDQGKVIGLDPSMIDPEVGWAKTLYYLKEANIHIYNPLATAEVPGAAQRTSNIQTADLSNTQQIVQYINLLNALDQEISDVAGVNKQREGQISPGEAVSNAQSNVSMSALLTEIYFFQHDKVWERVLTSALQLTQSLLKDKPFAAQWVLDDLSLATLAISPGDMPYEDFALFVTNSIKENKLFNSLETLADRLLQANRAKFSDIIKTYRAVSSQELENQIIASEQQTLKEQQEQAAQTLQQQAELQKQQQEFELEKQQREFEHDILLAQIESFKFQRDQDINDNQVPDQLEIAKFKADVALKSRQLDIQEEALAQKAAIAAKKKSEK